jgi:hypothetical protein
MLNIRNQIRMAQARAYFLKAVDAYYYEHREEIQRDRLLAVYDRMEMDRVYKMYLFMNWDTSKLRVYDQDQMV